MELLQVLRALGINMKLDGEKLLLDAPSGVISDQLLRQIKDCKKDIIAAISYLYRNHPGIKYPSLGHVLSSAQKEMWTLSKYEDNAYSNVIVTLAIHGNIEKLVLKAAITDLLERHEPLRTIFIDDEDGPVQVILDTTEVIPSIKELDCYQHNKSEFFESIVEAERNFQFNLSKGPLFKVTLVQIEDKLCYLILVVHHIVCDGISLNIIKRDLSHLYTSRLNGVKPSLPKLSIQYKDYIIAQRNNAEENTANKLFWEQKFAGGIPYLELPTDFQKSKTPSFRGGIVRNLIEPEIFTPFKELCIKTNTTLYAGLFALVNALMYLKSGKNDIVIGTSTSGRLDILTTDLVGLFVNTLAIRIVFAPDQPFISLMGIVKEALKGALTHQNYSISKLIEFLRNNFLGFRPPLFEVMVLLHNHVETNKTFQVDSLEIEDLAYQAYNGNFPLTFNFTELSTGLDISLEYNTDLFKEETANSIIQQFKIILQSAVTEPQTNIKDLNYLSSIDKDKMLSFFSGPVKPLPKEVTFIDIFFQQADYAPNKIAIKYKSQEYTYGQLKALSTSFAANLIQVFGVKNNQPIAILSDRNDQLLIGSLGILLAGAAYVPIEPNTPISRIKHILQDIKARCIIVESKYKHLLANVENVVILEDELRASSATLVSGFVSTATPETLAYIIYTSGSTGLPKGALLEHRGMLNHLLAKKEDLHLDAESIIAQTAAASFDIAIWQMMVAFICGGTTVIYDNDVVNVPQVLCKQLNDDQITILEVVPSYIALLLEFGEPTNFKHLKYLIATGEALSYSLLEAWLTANPSIPMVNAYGPTEASDDVTHKIYFQAPEDGNISIGTPIRNLSIYVVDSWGTLMPIGVKGQLIVSGVGVGAGYLNNPQKTAEAFGLDQYFDHKYSRKTYATGDIGQWLPDGSLQFFGRIDDQVKVRGYRIELGEIENNISRFTIINQAAVCVKNNDLGGMLIAFVTLKNATKDALDEVKERLIEFLPQYMLPHHWIILEKMPLTINGKINRKELQNYELSNYIHTGSDHIIARTNFTDIENDIYLEWCQVLGRNIDITNRDNFFEIGGDSFKAIMLAAKLSKKFNSHVSIKDIFISYSITLQAQLLVAPINKNSIILPYQGQRESFPLSAVQLGIFNQHQRSNYSSQYHIRGAFEVLGLLNINKVFSAFETLSQRHSILRTYFVLENEVPVQSINSSAYTITPTVYVKNVSDVLYNQPFDLSKCPLLRVILIKHGNSIKHLVFEAHHIIFDGLSIDLLIKEFILLYQGKSLNEAPLQYKDYIMWTLQPAYRQRMELQMNYWLNTYNNKTINHLRLPIDNISTSMAADLQEDLVDIENYTKISVFCLNNGFTLSNYLLSAYFILLHKYSNQNEIVVGIPVTGRTDEDTFQIIGPFASLVPFLYNVEEQETLATMVHNVQEQNIEILSNQDFSFSDLNKKINVRFSQDSNVLFNAAFSSEYFDSSYKDSLMLILDDNLSLIATNNELSDLKYQIHMRTSIYRDTIKIRFEYRSELFTQETIKELARSFNRILFDICKFPEAKILDVDLLSDEKKFTSSFEEESNFDF